MLGKNFKRGVLGYVIPHDPHEGSSYASLIILLLVHVYSFIWRMVADEEQRKEIIAGNVCVTLSRSKRIPA